MLNVNTSKNPASVIISQEGGSPATPSMSSSGTMRKRAPPKQKEPELQFFEMTVLAFILSHPSSKTIMTLDRNALFDECKSVHKSFHEWPNWINHRLTRVVLEEKFIKEQAQKSMTMLGRSSAQRSSTANSLFMMTSQPQSTTHSRSGSSRFGPASNR